MKKLLEQPFVSVAFKPIIKGDYYNKLREKVEMNKTIKTVTSVLTSADIADINEISTIKDVIEDLQPAGVLYDKNLFVDFVNTLKSSSHGNSRDQLVQSLIGSCCAGDIQTFELELQALNGGHISRISTNKPLTLDLLKSPKYETTVNTSAWGPLLWCL